MRRKVKLVVFLHTAKAPVLKKKNGFQSNTSGNVTCLALWVVYRGSKMYVNWGNKIKAPKTVCLAVKGWRRNKMLKYWFSS